MIKVIAVGKKNAFEQEIADYSKRLKPPFTAQWVELPYSQRSGEQARQEESAAILAKLAPKDFLILLDERGKELSNFELADKLTSAPNITIAIGGAYGVSAELRERADFLWSLGKLVLPHQIVRLILAEQIYRSQAIHTGHPYHHV